MSYDIYTQKQPTGTPLSGTLSNKKTVHRNPSVQLALNGQAVYLYDFQATAKVTRQEEDMSGQDSSTKKSDKGVKAKELTVTGLIPYRQKEWLQNLFKLAEAITGKGEQVKYRIANVTAEAINMREGVFSGEISASEDYVLGWQVNFTLREVNSVSEKKSKQAKKKKPKAKVQDEKATASKINNSEANNKDKVPVSSPPKTNSEEQNKRTEFDKWLEKWGL